MGQDFVDQSARAWKPLGAAERAFLLAALQEDISSLPTRSLAFDWETFTRRAHSDGLAPYLYVRLTDAPVQLPTGVMAQLKRSYYQTVSANHIRFLELERLGRLLSDEGIRLMLLKGGALAQTVYPDPGVRFMGDIDLTVPPRQTVAALRLLQAEGYQLHEEGNDARLQPETLADTALLRAQGWHVRLARTVRGKNVDLEFHWPLRERVLVSQAARLDLEHMWQMAEPLNAEGTLWQMSPPWQLLYLCLHTALQHRFTDLGLRLYLDVDRVVRHYGEQPSFWQAFVALAVTSRAAPAAYFTLDLTRTLFGTPLPGAALAALAPSPRRQRAFRNSLQEADITNRTRALYDQNRYRWRLLTLQSIFDLLAGPGMVLFPGRSFLRSYYDAEGPGRVALYALWHPLHALARAGRRRWRRLVRTST